jgi:hypothetical protein
MNKFENQPIHPTLDAYARREQARTLATPAGFAAKVQLQLVSAANRRRKVTRFAGWVLAASVLVAVGIFTLQRPRQAAPVVLPRETELAAVKLADEWNEAGRSLENLTNRAAEPALTPAKRLLLGSARIQLPEANPNEPGLPPIEFANAAAAGLEPIAATPRRAVNTMLRDLGIDPFGN